MAQQVATHTQGDQQGGGQGLSWSHPTDALTQPIRVKHPKPICQVSELMSHYSCKADEVESHLANEFTTLADVGVFHAGLFDDNARGVLLEPSVTYVVEVFTEADEYALGRIPYVYTVESMLDSIERWGWYEDEPEYAPPLSEYKPPKCGTSSLNGFASHETWDQTPWPLIIAVRPNKDEWIDWYLNSIYQDHLSADTLQSFWWPMSIRAISKDNRQVKKLLSLLNIKREIKV